MTTKALKETKRKAYGYVRVSTAEQAEHKTSIKQQIVDLEAYGAKRGIEFVEVSRRTRSFGFGLEASRVQSDDAARDWGRSPRRLHCRVRHGANVA